MLIYYNGQADLPTLPTYLFDIPTFHSIYEKVISPNLDNRLLHLGRVPVIHSQLSPSGQSLAAAIKPQRRRNHVLLPRRQDARQQLEEGQTGVCGGQGEDGKAAVRGRQGQGRRQLHLQLPAVVRACVFFILSLLRCFTQRIWLPTSLFRVLSTPQCFISNE